MNILNYFLSCHSSFHFINNKVHIPIKAINYLLLFVRLTTILVRFRFSMNYAFSNMRALIPKVANLMRTIF
jgi:hypothetical protein